MANRIKGFTLGGNKTNGSHGEDTLPRLAAQANNEHAAYESKSRERLRHARAAGDFLKRAKSLLKHGEWQDWQKANIKFPVRTVRRYMAWAELWDGKSEVNTDLEDKWVELQRRPDPDATKTENDQSPNGNVITAKNDPVLAVMTNPTGEGNGQASSQSDGALEPPSNGHTAPTNGATASAPPEPAPTPKAPPDTPPAATNGTHKSPDQEDAEDENTVGGQMKAVNSKIESYCRELLKLAQEKCPDDIWLDDRGTRDAHIQKIKDACTMLRVKKCSNVCPRCDGEGCHECRESGRVPKANYDQLV